MILQARYGGPKFARRSGAEDVMALLSLISRFTTYTFSNPEIARNRAQAAAFGQIDERRYIRSPINSRIEMGWQDQRGWQKQSQSRGVNMSSAGASVISPEPIAVGSAVYRPRRNCNSWARPLYGTAPRRSPNS